MSSHADTIRRIVSDCGWARSYEKDEVFAALDALVAENQQLREALEKVAALDGGEWGARMIASTALDGSPDA